nr:hypothetical protein [Tanacetum cinerariifolium]
MTSITAQQTKLDLKLVPKKNPLDIGKCNGRIPRGLKPKEETFQVFLDALVLTPCYHAFVITADVPEIYMHQIEDQDFDALLSKEDTVSFLRELGHTGVINLLNDVVIDPMHQPWRTFAAFINRSLSGKTTALDKLCLSRAHNLQGIPQMKESKAYKMYLGYATSTVPPRVTRKFKKASPSKKDSMPVPTDEEPVQKGNKVDVARGKGIDLLSEVALTKEAQMKEVRKKSLRDFHKSHPSGSVAPDVTKDESTESDLESWGNDEDNSNNEKGSEQENGSEEHELDSEQDTNKSESNSESDKQDDDEVNDDDDDDEDDDNDDDKSEDIPPADTEIVSPLDVHVHHESTPSPLQTIETSNIPSLIPNFASVIRLNDRVITLEKVVAELKNDPLYTQVIDLVDDHLDTRIGATREEFINFLSASLTNRIIKQASSQPQSSYEAAAILTKFELKKILIDKMNSSESYLTAPEHQECYDGLIKSYNLDKDFFSFYDVYSLKRSRDDKDKDEGLFIGTDQGLKKRKTSKDAEPTTSLKNKDSSFNSSKGNNSQPKSSGSLFMWRNQSSRLLSSLKDITKNIDIEYLPKRRWSTLEKKRAHCMIKDINKLLKERRMMKSLEKFVGSRLYETNIRLLKRTI